ncbi:uncharacterized protein PV07_04306 [Cladophialophora immunda]|uniref:Nephrocystin 3-like N-terminal domain-containing protein n=1 Tax=Cladophialophora immunda TaxID=569365 RepID=A0A0D2DAP6_9EURO|nr:uncharacterized protein PV07_04306 [Cladophialophora immunda]KIW32784.1 hypothetical protein PV07_04306 [Cladophialophora immunda]
MADPFSIVGVISTADVVFTRLFKYIKGVKRAEKEILDLAAEVKRLYWTLQSVRTAAEDLKDLNGHAPLVDPKHISDCVTTLDELRQLLSKYQPEAEAEADLSIRTVKARWMWPIDKSKALDLKRKVHDHNISFTTSLSANGLSMMVAMLSNAESSASTLEKVSKLLEASAQIELNKTTRELLSVVGPTRPVAYQKTNAQLHHPGTSIWFIESDEFRWWLETQNSKLWVFGIPGAGKSVLAATAIEKALAYANSDNAVAYFYCDYKDPETQDPVKILGSLAEQIARQDSRSFDKLKAFVHAHTHDKDLQTFITNEEELYNLVIAMAENFETTMIIVDGLDECEDVRRTTRCLTLLSEGSARIKTFLSSRKIVDVEDFMSDYKRISIAARSSDLRLYVAAEMENRMKPSNVRRLRIKDPSLKGEIMDKLINGADGMFRWVAVQLDSFCEMPSDFDIREALNTLPRGLFPSYERVLDRISRKHPLTQRLVQCALKWITYCNMEVPALLEALAVTEDTRQLKNLRKYEVQDILLHCESLVRLSSDEYKVELAHFTVKEFLTSVDTTARPDLSSYKLNFESDRQYLAATCLTFLCCGDFDICLREEELASRHHEHPFRPQAVVKWVNLARDCTESPSVRQPLMRLFGPQSTRLVTSWAQEYLFELFGFRSINPSGFFGSRIRWKSFTPLHWAAMMRLPDVCRSLTCVPGQTQAGSSFGTPLQMALVGCQCYCVAQQGSREASLSYGFDAEIEDIFLLETVQVLIDHGADVDGNWVHQDGVLSMTPLVMTLLTQEWYSFRLLLRAGAKCGIVVIEKLIEYLDSSEFECDDTGLMSIVDSISEQEIAHGAKEAFSRMKAKFCTLSPSVDMPSGALQILSQSADVEAQLELVLDSARFNNEKSMTSLLEGLSIDCNSKNHAGESALMLAARHCNVPILRMLLEHGAELEIADEKGRTPLHHAVKSGMPEAVEFLLMTGANPLLCDHRGWNAWHFCASRTDADSRHILDLLLENAPAGVDTVDKKGRTPWLVAAQEGIPEHFSFFEEAGANLWSTDVSGRTALHIAAVNGNCEWVKRLLSRGHDPASLDSKGQNPLSYSVPTIWQHDSCFKLLYHHSPDLLLSKSPGAESALERLLMSDMWNSGSSATDEALESMITKSAEKILLGITIFLMASGFVHLRTPCRMLRTIFAEDRRCLTGLFDDKNLLEKMSRCLFQALDTLASSFLAGGHSEQDELVGLSIVLIDHLPEECLRKIRVKGRQILTFGLLRSDAIAKAILKRYVDLETRDLEMADDKHCVNALECVFWSPCGNALFEIILESAGSFDSKTLLGASLLHLAASAFYLDRVELLLSKGLDPNERDHGGSIALHYACYAQRVESATLLLTAGADPWLLNSNGVSSVQLAIQHGWLGFLQSIPVEGGRWRESCPLQLPHGLRAIKLHHAAAVYSQLECLKFLLGLSQYFKLEEQTDDGCTLLEIAVQRRCQPIVTYLLQSGATPHRARNGNTALHTAAEFGDLEIVNALLKHGFDPLEPGSYGRTPLSIAKTLNWTEVVSVIEAFIADKISQGQCGSVRAEKKTTPTNVSNSPRRELKYAIDSNNLQLCQRLVSETHFQVERCACCGSTNAILYSLWANKEEIFLYLLEAGLNYGEMMHQEYSAVHLCVMSNLPRALNRILDMCPELLFLRTNVHPLHLAVLAQRNECLKIMLEKRTDCWSRLHKSLTLSVNRDCPDSRVAHAQGSLDMWKRRGPQGHHLISIEDLLGVEISPELPNDLELTKGVNVSMLLGVGAHTALQCAAYNANVEAIRLLLEHGARVNQESSIYLDTALSIAARRPDSKAVCALLDYGASIHHFPSDSESCACSIRLAHSQVSGEKLIQSNLFRLPCCLDRRTLISELAASSRVLELYEAVGHPHEMIEPDGLGWTALHSCWNRGPAVMKAYILNSGLDLSGRTRCFGSALNYHWYDFNHGLLRRLLRRLGREQSLDMLNVKPEHRDTPLYAASAMGQLKILRLLLVSGADLDLIGGQMGTPLIAAASYGRLHIVKELISAGAGFSCFCPALGEVVNVFDQARDFPEIQRWLLVGRWMERSCIGWVGSTC